MQQGISEIATGKITDITDLVTAFTNKVIPDLATAKTPLDIQDLTTATNTEVIPDLATCVNY